MPSLQVREMPTALYKTLQQEAKYEHRSLAQQAIVTLARGMNARDDHPKRRQKLLTTITEAAICPTNLNLSDAVDVVNEDRNR